MDAILTSQFVHFGSMPVCLDQSCHFVRRQHPTLADVRRYSRIGRRGLYLL
ncbi:hypothetical protein [Streptomyces sp. NPDC002156]